MKNGNALVAVLMIVAGFLLGWVFGTSQPAYNLSKKGEIASSKAEMFRGDMRKLWTDHAVYTRLYIVSAVNDMSDQEELLERLLKNQEEIGEAIKPVYGEDAGNKLTALLKDHIGYAGEVVGAAVKKDAIALGKADLKWRQNADEISEFLAGANPNWKKDDLKKMLTDHLDITRQEAVDIIAGRADASISDFDKVNSQILQMADALAAGVVKQYPDKFR